MKLFTSLALGAAGVSATTVEDKCLICSHVGFAASEDAAIAGKRFKMIDRNCVFFKDRPFILTSRHGLKTGILLIIWFDRS